MGRAIALSLVLQTNLYNRPEDIYSKSLRLYVTYVVVTYLGIITYILSIQTLRSSH